MRRCQLTAAGFAYAPGEGVADWVDTVGSRWEAQDEFAARESGRAHASDETPNADEPLADEPAVDDAASPNEERRPLGGRRRYPTRRSVFQLFRGRWLPSHETVWRVVRIVS